MPEHPFRGCRRSLYVTNKPLKERFKRLPRKPSAPGGSRSDLACRVAPRLIANPEEYQEANVVGLRVTRSRQQEERGRGTGDYFDARSAQVKKMSVFVGVDIAAKTFEVVVRRDGKNARAVSFEQTPQGHAQALKQLKALNPKHVVMEATGIYYLDLAVLLSEAGLPVSVINPKSARHFAELKMAGSKTDGIDSALLAEFGERMSPKLWVAPDSTRLALRDLGRQINRLTASRTQAKNRLHALQAKSMTLPLLLKDEREGITLLDRRIDRLKRAALELVAASAQLQAQFDAMLAAKGIGELSAISIISELCVLPEHLKAPQVSRYAGLDVRLCQSGTSINRPARLSKAGNAYLRAALYMPAMSAIQHDQRAKAFYDALVARGKKKMQALCAVMRKYLTGLWVCFNCCTPFDSSKLFSDQYGKNA